MQNAPKAYTVNSAAAALGVDRRTVKAAMESVPTDAQDGGRERWTLPTIHQALLARARRNVASEQYSELNKCADVIEKAAGDLATALQSLRSKPALGERRRYAVEVGPLIGKLDRAMSMVMSADDRVLLEPLRDRITANAINTLMNACGWRLDVGSK